MVAPPSSRPLAGGQVRAVVFDRDGVLTGFDFPWMRRFFATHAGLSIPELADRWDRWAETFGRPLHDDEEADALVAFWQALAVERGLSDQALEQLVGFDYTEKLTVFPETLDVLRQVRARGLPIGVLTNFSLASLPASLRVTGLAPLVDAAIPATVRGWSKPDPRAYRAIAEGLGVPQESCLYLDDEPALVAGARQVGMRGWRVDRRREAHDLEGGVLADLSGVPLILDHLAVP